MADFNIEIRKRTGATFGDRYLPVTKTENVEGLLVGGLLNPALLPDYVKSGMFPAGEYTPSVSATMVDVKNAVTLPSGSTSYQGAMILILNSSQRNVIVSTGFTVYAESGKVIGDDIAVIDELDTGDYLVCMDADGFEWAVINNTIDLVSTSQSGLMWATDKVKLDGIQANANNYTHPTYTVRSIDTVDVEVYDLFSSDDKGHVTNVSKRTLPTASPANHGVMSNTDKSKLDGIEANANNYIHFTGGHNANELLSGTQHISAINVNSEGHVTSVSVATITSASTASKGIVELATNAEAQTGSDSTRAVTPAGVKTSIDYYKSIQIFANQAEADLAITNDTVADGAIVGIVV